MNLHFAFHLVGAAVCVAISYGVNQHQRPKYEPSYAPQAYTEPQGTLHLGYHGEALTFPVMTTHVVSRDIQRVGHDYRLRELAIRATAPADQQAKLELYVDVSRVARGDSSASSDPRSLIQVELPVARSGRFGTRPSYVIVDGGPPRKVISGNLLLTEVNLQHQDTAKYRAAGRLELQLDGPNGVELITGRLEGRIAWDASQ